MLGGTQQRVGKQGCSRGIIDRKAQLRYNRGSMIHVGNFKGMEVFVLVFLNDDLSSGITIWQIEVEGSAYRS